MSLNTLIIISSLFHSGRICAKISKIPASGLSLNLISNIFMMFSVSFYSSYAGLTRRGNSVLIPMTSQPSAMFQCGFPIQTHITYVFGRLRFCLIQNINGITVYNFDIYLSCRIQIHSASSVNFVYPELKSFLQIDLLSLHEP